MGRKLGQHFLTSTAIAKRMVESAHIQPSDVVWEVGPGKGILTQFLIEKAKQVIAIEKDRNLVLYLKEKFNGAKNLEVVEGDILEISNVSAKGGSASGGKFLISNKIPKSKIKNQNDNSKFKIPKKYKIVANLPYYITSRFLRLFLEEIQHKPQSMVLMVQKEVAERICAKPPHMNLLALSVQAFGKPRILFRVSAGSFSPPPDVDSAVIAIENISDAFFQKHHISPQEFFKFPKKAFSQKRKMLRSSLGNIAEVPLPYIDMRKWDFRNIQDFLTKRPQELMLEDWMLFLQTN